MKREEIIIIHGLNGSPEGHWQGFLYRDLKKMGKRVYFPQFPNNDRPNLDKWLVYLSKFERHIHENTTIVAHSMGVILWLHYLEKKLKIKINKTILVAPPSRTFLESYDENTKGFSNFQIDKEKFLKYTETSLLIATAKDEFCNPPAKELYLKRLGTEYLELEARAGHINIKSGYGCWTDILDLTLNS